MSEPKVLSMAAAKWKRTVQRGEGYSMSERYPITCRHDVETGFVVVRTETDEAELEYYLTESEAVDLGAALLKAARGAS